MLPMAQSPSLSWKLEPAVLWPWWRQRVRRMIYTLAGEMPWATGITFSRWTWRYREGVRLLPSIFMWGGSLSAPEEIGLTPGQRGFPGWCGSWEQYGSDHPSHIRRKAVNPDRPPVTYSPRSCLSTGPQRGAGALSVAFLLQDILGTPCYSFYFTSLFVFLLYFCFLNPQFGFNGNESLPLSSLSRHTFNV